MITRYLIYIILFITLGKEITCQDIHFSQFNLAPLNLNPAMTGSFNGDYRFVGNLRNQWSSVTVPYKTFAFSVEKNKVYKSPISVGIQINQDNAGDSRFNTFQANFSGSYKYELKDSSHYIVGGTQIGITNRQTEGIPGDYRISVGPMSAGGCWCTMGCCCCCCCLVVVAPPWG